MFPSHHNWPYTRELEQLIEGMMNPEFSARPTAVQLLQTSAACPVRHRQPDRAARACHQAPGIFQPNTRCTDSNHIHSHTTNHARNALTPGYTASAVTHSIPSSDSHSSFHFLPPS
ncbi:hypothetical protein Pelo_15393 [Pelomyxa schiedti]|nr:hypothetical protein Pelo_15393 [Pelomyxa schiedti]